MKDILHTNAREILKLALSRLTACFPRANLTRAALIVLVLAVLFAPAFLTIFWHVFHGNAIEYRGENISVPLRWIAQTDFYGVTLWKLPFTFIFWDRPKSMISFKRSVGLDGVTPEQRYALWESAYSTVLAKGRNTVSGPVKIASGDRETVCVQSVSIDNPNRASASCLVLQGKWTADFFGEKRDAEEFFAVVRRMSGK